MAIVEPVDVGGEFLRIRIFRVREPVLIVFAFEVD
jgi:hypothetical protein